MPILRLAYVTLFLIALLAVFVLWSEVGGQTHLDLMPWYLKFGLGLGAAFAVTKATAAAVGGTNAWNGGTLKWLGILAALMVGCGLASYYVHIYGEQDEDNSDDNMTSELILGSAAAGGLVAESSDRGVAQGLEIALGAGGALLRGGEIGFGLGDSLVGGS
jgi:hypothetical protein